MKAKPFSRTPVISRQNTQSAEYAMTLKVVPVIHPQPPPLLPKHIVSPDPCLLLFVHARLGEGKEIESSESERTEGAGDEGWNWQRVRSNGERQTKVK